MIRLLVGLLLVGLILYAVMDIQGYGNQQDQSIYSEQVDRAERLQRKIEQDASDRLRQIDKATQ